MWNDSAGRISLGSLFRPSCHSLLPSFSQWGDQDAYQHVNNVRYISWCETARLYSLRQMLDEYLKENPQVRDAGAAGQNGPMVEVVTREISTCD